MKGWEIYYNILFCHKIFKGEVINALIWLVIWSTNLVLPISNGTYPSKEQVEFQDEGICKISFRFWIESRLKSELEKLNMVLGAQENQKCKNKNK